MFVVSIFLYILTILGTMGHVMACSMEHGCFEASCLSFREGGFIIGDCELGACSSCASFSGGNV